MASKKNQELTIQTMFRWAKKRLEKHVLKPSKKKSGTAAKASVK